MGYRIKSEKQNSLFQKLSEDYDIYAPTVKKGEGCFSDTDVVRYDRIHSFSEIEWEKRSDYSFKEILFPVNETLFYFTEKNMTEPETPKRKTIIFLRSCDLHAVKRLDQIYLKNGAEDYYYRRRRELVKFVLMGCQHTCSSGFCVSMGTNTYEDYDFSFEMTEEEIRIDCRDEEFSELFSGICQEKEDIRPAYVTENKEHVTLPRKLSNESFTDEIWKEYGSRCIACGRCNFVCPTCTCFTMQDIFYQDNKNVGERRRVWASCQVDGYTDMAGGISFRKEQSDRVRFKVMHKIYDYEKRFGYPMCVGCGRCDDVCPEYISYSNLVNRLAEKEDR